MSPPPFMWPFSLFAPGNLNQPILPGWSFGNVSVNYAGNADIEKDVVEKVASYGKQLGIIADVVLEFAGDKPPKGEQPLKQLRDIAAKVRKVKEEHKRSLTDEADDAMAKLAKSDEAEVRRIAGKYARKTSGTGA